MGGVIDEYFNHHIENINRHKKVQIQLTINNLKIVIITSSLKDYNEKLVLKDTSKNNRGCDNYEFD